ncbi:MAG: hypothetical protein ACRCY4_05110 [Brevinema sp.]
MDDNEIKPRVSRAERLRETRLGNKECENCPDTQPLRRKNTIMPLFIVIVVVFAVVYVINQRDSSPYQGGGVVNVGNDRKISYTTVSDATRTGLSLVLENNSSQPWIVSNLVIYSPKGETPIEFQQEIAAKDIAAIFVPMPLDGTKYKIEVSPR